jgi:hypothetical protein
MTLILDALNEENERHPMKNHHQNGIPERSAAQIRGTNLTEDIDMNMIRVEIEATRMNSD